MEIRSKEIRMIPIGEIVLNEKNRNMHPDDQIDHLVEQYKYQGFRSPLIVSTRSGKLVCGHGRYLAAKKVGISELPVIFQDFESEEQEYAFGVAENATQNWSHLDLSAINADLPQLGPDFDIAMLGIKDFTIEALDRMLGDEEAVPGIPKEAKTKIGDLYELGGHRVLCGDSTSCTDVDRLMGGEKSNICFTSPPYNLGNNAKLRGYNADGSDSAYNEKTDHKSQAEYLQFLIEFTNIALIHSEIAFINIQLLAGNKLALPEYWNQFRGNLIDVLVWDKEHAAPSMAVRVLNSVWEFVFAFTMNSDPKRTIFTAPDFRGTIDNVFRLNPIGKKDPLAKDHGAVFPVAFVEHFISKFSTGSVLDLFGGSGSTLIAAEKLGRRSFLMELDPSYTDVIVSRYCKYVGSRDIKRNGEPITWDGE